MNKSELELLAPAKNYTTGKAAIDNGADAVYIAGPAFGAREAAGNSITDIERLANYTHQYYAKTYLTLNTILYDNELEAARKLVCDAWNAGVDAVIIQDMALLEMELPPVPLFASTQTHNATPEKVKFLQDVGFQRVILARELSLAQIAAIKAATTVDLEAFIHGALCVCYSGQCYLSHALTGRSANRGACAQPCRSLYDLADGDGQLIARNKHLLSLRDFNLTEHLDSLVDAGVTSFKIEGRLKNESYVKNVVAHYRKEIDKILARRSLSKSSCGRSLHAFTPNVEQSFSRGFTDYFITGGRKEIFSHDTGKAIGQHIGHIDKKCNDYFTYTGEPLHNADGICFFDAQGQLQGTNVNRVDGNKVWMQNTEGLTAGIDIFRNFDYAFEQQLAYETRRAIQADIYFSSDEKNAVITATDECGITVSLVVPQCGEPARNEKMACQNIKTQFEKSGQTIFDFNVVKIDAEQVYFYPLSLLNTWRRELSGLLQNEREKQRKRETKNIAPTTLPFPDCEVDYHANISNALARQFYERHGAIVTAMAFEKETPAEAQLMCTKYCIKHAIGACRNHGGNKTVKEPLYLLNNGRKLRLTFDCVQCQMTIHQ